MIIRGSLIQFYNKGILYINMFDEFKGMFRGSNKKYDDSDILAIMVVIKAALKFNRGSEKDSIDVCSSFDIYNMDNATEALQFKIKGETFIFIPRAKSDSGVGGIVHPSKTEACKDVTPFYELLQHIYNILKFIVGTVQIEKGMPALVSHSLLEEQRIKLSPNGDGDVIINKDHLKGWGYNRTDLREAPLIRILDDGPRIANVGKKSSYVYELNAASTIRKKSIQNMVKILKQIMTQITSGEHKGEYIIKTSLDLGLIKQIKNSVNDIHQQMYNSYKGHIFNAQKIFVKKATLVADNKSNPELDYKGNDKDRGSFSTQPYDREQKGMPRYKDEKRNDHTDEKRHDHTDEKRHDHTDEKRHDHTDEQPGDHKDEQRHDYRDEQRHDYRDGRGRDNRLPRGLHKRRHSSGDRDRYRDRDRDRDRDRGLRHLQNLDGYLPDALGSYGINKYNTQRWGGSRRSLKSKGGRRKVNKKSRHKVNKKSRHKVNKKSRRKVNKKSRRKVNKKSRRRR